MAFNWSAFLGTNLAPIINSIKDLVDEYVLIEQEKAVLKREIDKQVQDYNKELAVKVLELEPEITKRHGQDMMSDSWLSKHIRPLCLIYILILYTFFIAFGSVESLGIDTAAGATAIKPFAMVVIGFYFGGRSFEKIGALVSRPKKIE